MGVWIEIFLVFGFSSFTSVTPYVGVWIEICRKPDRRKMKRSPPMWGCGLKFGAVNGVGTTVMSPPMWGCGLK